ncbi:hypothetical protein [Methanopyrus sp.]
MTLQYAIGRSGWFPEWIRVEPASTVEKEISKALNEYSKNIDEWSLVIAYGLL